MIILLALLIGVVAGLRSFLAPAAVGLAARLGLLTLAGTPLAPLGNAWLPWLLVACAAGELVADKLPMTPSRKQAPGFVFRIVTGAISGAAIGGTSGMLAIGGIAGAIGAIIGTMGGAAARGRLAAAFGRDLPAALLEDAVAIVAAIVIVTAAR